MRTPLSPFLTTSAARSSVCPAGLLHPAADPRVVLVLAHLGSTLSLRRGSTASSTSSRPDAPPPVLCTLQSLPPTHSLPFHVGAEPPCSLSSGLTACTAADFSLASHAFTTRLAFSPFPVQRLLPPGPPLLSD